MPKVIEKLEERILQVSQELFSKYGYRDVDMRAIASEAGIAVGTLYNYFPNKKRLFMEVFINSWEGTFSRLDGILEGCDSVDRKLVLFVDEVYKGIADKKGIGIQLLEDSLHRVSAATKQKNQNPLDNIGLTLKEKTILLIRELVSDNHSMEPVLDKFSYTIVLLIWGLVFQFPGDKPGNIDFVCDMIRCYISS